MIDEERQGGLPYKTLLLVTCLSFAIDECISDGNIPPKNFNGAEQRNAQEYFTYHLRYGNISSIMNVPTILHTESAKQNLQTKIFKDIPGRENALNQTENEEDKFGGYSQYSLELDEKMVNEKFQFDSATKIQQNFCADKTEEGI